MKEWLSIRLISRFNFLYKFFVKHSKSFPLSLIEPGLKLGHDTSEDSNRVKNSENI